MGTGQVFLGLLSRQRPDAVSQESRPQDVAERAGRHPTRTGRAEERESAAQSAPGQTGTGTGQVSERRGGASADPHTARRGGAGTEGAASSEPGCFTGNLLLLSTKFYI